MDTTLLSLDGNLGLALPIGSEERCGECTVLGLQYFLSEINYCLNAGK